MCADRASRQRGQALVEALIAMIAFVPLLYGMAWVAQLIDLRQATQQAARAVAFDCTVRPQACTSAASSPTVAGEIRRRHFAGHGGPVRSGDVLSGAVTRETRRTNWVDRSGGSLLVQWEDVSITLAQPRFDSPLAFAGSSAERVFPGAARTVSELAGPGRFGLDIEGGLVDATVQARVAAGAASDAWLARLMPVALTIRANVALLTDAWNASGPYGDAPDSVETRVTDGARLPIIDPLIDAGWLAVRGLLAVAGALRIEPAARALRWHETDVDLVPPDRLGDTPVAAPRPALEQP